MQIATNKQTSVFVHEQPYISVALSTGYQQSQDALPPAIRPGCEKPLRALLQTPTRRLPAHRPTERHLRPTARRRQLSSRVIRAGSDVPCRRPPTSRLISLSVSALARRKSRKSSTTSWTSSSSSPSAPAFERLAWSVSAPPGAASCEPRPSVATSCRAGGERKGGRGASTARRRESERFTTMTMMRQQTRTPMHQRSALTCVNSTRRLQ